MAFPEYSPAFFDDVEGQVVQCRYVFNDEEELNQANNRLTDTLLEALMKLFSFLSPGFSLTPSSIAVSTMYGHPRPDDELLCPWVEMGNGMRYLLYYGANIPTPMGRHCQIIVVCMQDNNLTRQYLADAVHFGNNVE